MSMQAPVLNVDSKTFNPVSNNQVSNSGFNNYQRSSSSSSPNSLSSPNSSSSLSSSNAGIYDEVKELGVNEVNEVNQLNEVNEVREVINSFDSTQNNERNVLLVKGSESTRKEFKESNQVNQVNYEPRTIYVEIQRSRLNRLRSYLEKLKRPFEADPYNLRIADAPIIDAMIRCAVVSPTALKQYLDEAYSTPAYLPPEDEVFQLSAQEEPKTQEQKRRERQERNLNRNLRVELSSASSERILNLQIALTEVMGWQPDINALGNALLDLSQHKSRKIVQSIADHYKNAGKKEESSKKEKSAL